MTKKPCKQQASQLPVTLEQTIRKLTNNVFAAMLMVKKIAEAGDLRQQKFEASLAYITKSIGRIEEQIRLISRHLDI